MSASVTVFESENLRATVRWREAGPGTGVVVAVEARTGSTRPEVLKLDILRHHPHWHHRLVSGHEVIHDLDVDCPLDDALGVVERLPELLTAAGALVPARELASRKRLSEVIEAVRAGIGAVLCPRPSTPPPDLSDSRETSPGLTDSHRHGPPSRVPGGG
jgi:hypothetical protein